MASNEIEGARRLLNLAQKWSHAAAEMLARARSNDDGAIAELAQAQVATSAREVAAAAGYLEEVERRWEVIDVESDAEASATEAERTAPATREGDSGAVGNASGIAPPIDHSQVSLSDSSDVVVIAGEVDKSATRDLSVPYHVTVEGCGTSKANGTYTITGYHAGAPKYSKILFDHGFHAFSHMTILREETDGEVRKWLLAESTLSGYSERSKMAYYQHATNAKDASNLPPRFKWKRVNSDFFSKQRTRYTSGSARLPAAKISYESGVSLEAHYGELVVEGCGTTQDAAGREREDVNGIYKEQDIRNGSSSYFKAGPDGIPRVNLYRGAFSNAEGYHNWYIAILWEGRWLESYRTHGGSGELPLAHLGFTWETARGDTFRFR